jgi:uncharacterized protein YpuA (DUF1002 family)
VSLDANSRNAIEDLTSRLSSPLGVTKLTDHEIEQLANAVISALPGSGSVSLDTKSMKAIEGLTSELSSALGVTKLTDHEMEQLTRAVISALVGTEAVRARIERVVNEYKITTTDQDDASQTLVNGIIAALRGI